MTVSLADLLDGEPWARAVMRASLLEHARGEWLDLVRVHIYGHRPPEARLDDAALVDDVLRTLAEERRPDVGASVRAGIDAARALQPEPRNRHERRRVAALRRRGVML